MLPSLHKEVHQLHSHLCAGLADPTRILLLYALVDGPHNVTEFDSGRAVAAADRLAAPEGAA